MKNVQHYVQYILMFCFFNMLNQSQSTNRSPPSVFSKHPSLRRNWCFPSSVPGSSPGISAQGSWASGKKGFAESLKEAWKGLGVLLLNLALSPCAASLKLRDCKASWEQPCRSFLPCLLAPHQVCTALNRGHALSTQLIK